MNRMLQLARQMHQRRMSYFYLAPTEDDYASAQFHAGQLKLPLRSMDMPVDDPYDDDGDDAERLD